VRNSSAAILLALAVSACGSGKGPAPAPTDAPAQPVAFVQLFEWKWSDIARECEEFLGNAGYTAVQVSPPNEHIEGPAWWTRYQPVSYKIESRGGTREEFADMVARCDAAGVDVYADAVINHMAGFPEGVGVAGSPFSEYDYPAVPYDVDDFHHCGRNETDRIADYQDLWEVQSCQLGTLDDIDTGKPEVQASIAAYLNDLLSLGVAGFRLDAVKHIDHDELHTILQQIDGNPFIYQEVIDHGGEPVSAKDYVRDGRVTEFKYPRVILDAFEKGDLDVLDAFWMQPGWLLGNEAVVFVDNHDIQRGHAFGDEVVNYKDGKRYELAVAFMLAHPYGYPLVMSSYAFEDDQQGPPDVSPHDAGGCGETWICEHRRDPTIAMLGFRKATEGRELIHWDIADDSVISFGRGDRGHILINHSDRPIDVAVATGLPSGDYVDIVGGRPITVNENGLIEETIEPLSVVAVLEDSK
jgi:alpha-amylase